MRAGRLFVLLAAWFAVNLLWTSALLFSLVQEPLHSPKPVLRSAPDSKAELTIARWPMARQAELREMFERLAWHSLATATLQHSEGRTYVFTGDIKEMWLRDSAAQAHPLVTLMLPRFPSLRALLIGVLLQQAEFILSDPYASAFGRPPRHALRVTQASGMPPRLTGKKGPYTVQSAYELDSLLYFLRLLHSLHQAAPSSDALRSREVHAAAMLVVRLLRIETFHDAHSPYRSSGLPNGGLGRAVKVGINLTWSGFRPSDDVCERGYPIAANVFAVAMLHHLAGLATALWHDGALAAEALQLSSDIKAAVAAHGTTEVEGFGRVYCYEVDGFGGCELLDDANVPSLLSLPYLDPDAHWLRCTWAP